MSDLRDLIARSLAANGALFEPVHPDGLEICAPSHVQTALSLPEWSRVGFGEVLPENAVRISLESEWAQRLAELLGDRGRYITLDLDLPLPAAAPRELERALVLANATFRLQEAGPAFSRYFLLVYHVTSTCDDKREDIVSLCINESNGAVANHLIDGLLGRLRELPAPGDEAVQAELPLALVGQRVHELAARRLPPLIRARLKPFLAGMERRMARDLERLHAYYSDLWSESALRRAGGRHPGDVGKNTEVEQSRLQAIEREYKAKMADLDNKYAMRVDVRLAQALRARLPVLRHEIILMRRKGLRKLHLDWSGLAKGFEVLPCEACGSTPKTYSVCDDRQHCLCPDCLSDCPACGRASCRACCPRACPRCGRPWELMPKSYRIASGEAPVLPRAESPPAGTG